MTGATTIYRLPATEAGAMTSSDLLAVMPDKQAKEIRRALARLYAARIVNREYFSAGNVRTWRYWRSEQ